jgi:hypothetical protein
MSGLLKAITACSLCMILLIVGVAVELVLLPSNWHRFSVATTVALALELS